MKRKYKLIGIKIPVYNECNCNIVLYSCYDLAEVHSKRIEYLKDKEITKKYSDILVKFEY